MRITVEIDDDVLAVARARATEQNVSVGQALSDLARRGVGASDPLPAFDVAADASPITPDMVGEAL